MRLRKYSRPSSGAMRMSKNPGWYVYDQYEEFIGWIVNLRHSPNVPLKGKPWMIISPKPHNGKWFATREYARDYLLKHPTYY